MKGTERKGNGNKNGVGNKMRDVKGREHLDWQNPRSATGLNWPFVSFMHDRPGYVFEYCIV